MNIQIDAKGKQCPLPVIEAKNAISGMTEAGIVEVTVDNEIAVQNLTKMADHKGLEAKSEKKSHQEYTVWMEVTEEFVKNKIKTDGNVSSTPLYYFSQTLLSLPSIPCIPDRIFSRSLLLTLCGLPFW